MTIRKITYIFLSIIIGNCTLVGQTYLNSGIFLHWNNKSTTAVETGGKKTPLPNENYFYPGISTGLEFPIKPNSVGLVMSVGVVWSSKNIMLNKYNIGNYDYTIKNFKGQNSRVIQTEGPSNGGLVDFNLHEQIQGYMNTNPGDYEVIATDIIIIANTLFKYTFPVNLGSDNKVFKKISTGLRYINPYFLGGFSNVIINRSLTMNAQIESYIEGVHGAKLINECVIDSSGTEICEEIVGKDPAPDPDFYLTYGFGFNIIIPQLKPLGNQLVFTLELLFQYNLAPDDGNKPFDDSYLYKQNGLTFRFATGIIL